MSSSIFLSINSRSYTDELFTAFLDLCVGAEKDKEEEEVANSDCMTVSINVEIWTQYTTSGCGETVKWGRAFLMKRN